VITGDKETIRRLLSLKSETFRKVVTAVEKTAVRMANHAKAGHEHGSDPHSRSRYENQTGNLTASIFPVGGSQQMQFEKLTESEVVGLFGVNGAAVGAVMEYAPEVEERYPFIWPAAVANIERFKQEIAACAPGATKSV
jgi:hypothetical protein